MEATGAARLDVRLLDSYDGTTDVVEWYTQASLLCEYRDVPLADVLPLRLKGGAFAVWSQLPAEDRRSVDAVRDALFTAFAMDDYAAHAAFVARTLQPGESVDVYLASLRRYATLFGGVTDRQLAAAFVNGLPAAVSETVRAGARAEKLTLASTLARARAVLGNEQAQAVAAARGDCERQQRPVPAAAAAAAAATAGCSCCCGGGGGRHRERTPAAAGGGGGGGGGSGGQRQRGRHSRPARRCWSCGDPDHLAAACPSGSGNAAGATPAPAQSPGH